MAITSDTLQRYYSSTGNGSLLPGANGSTPASVSNQIPVRQPGNLFTHALPAIGGTLGSIIGSAADVFTGPLGTIAGGSGGSALGKVLENKLEHQNLGSGVAGQAALGGVGAGAGEVLGAGFSALKGLGQAGAEAGGEAAANAGAEAVSNAGKMTASQAGRQGVGEKLLNVISPEDLPGSTVGNVGEATRLNRFATDDLGLRGSSTQKLGQLAKQFDSTNTELASKFATNGSTTSLDEINNAIDNAIKEHSLNPHQADISNLSNADLVKLNNSGAFDNPVNQKFNEAGASLKGIAAKMAQENGGNFSDSEVNTLRQEVDKFAKFNTSGANATDIPSEAAKASRSALNDILASKNPEARDLISKQSDMIKLGDVLGKKSGMARAGVRFGGVRIPVNVGSALEATQSGLGVALGGGSNAERLIPGLAQAGAQAVSGNLGSKTTPAAGQSTDFTAPSAGIQSVLSQYAGPNQSSVAGVDPNQIREAMVQDLANGGKNISKLNTLLSVVNDMQSNSQLPSSAVSKLSDYQNSLSALQNLSDTYNSPAGANDIQSSLANISKQIGNSTGLSGKSLTAALPTAYDDPKTVQIKLTALKQVIDQKAEEDLQSSIQSNKRTSNQQSFLTSLLGGSNG